MTPSKFALIAVCAVSPLLAGCDKQNLTSLGMLGDPATKVEAPPASSTSELYLTIVEGLIDQGRYRAALGYLDQYAVSEKKTPRFNMMHGEALLGVGKYDEATKAFSALEGTDLAAIGYNGLGRVEATRERWGEAERYFTQAVAARPSSADYLNNLGFAEIHLGGNDALAKAEFNLRQAQELDPKSVSIRNNLVLALSLAGKKEDAQAVLADIPTTRERVAVQKFATDWVQAKHKASVE
ncbi:MAG TPA: tetratricopeptide repeat protein [Parvibaculum sp.]|jgi:tetratricopeptide (TPR) repeat protein